MIDGNEKQNLKQTSIRLHADDLESIRQYAEDRGVPASTIIRSAWSLYKYAMEIKPPKRIVVIDLSNNNEVADVPFFDVDM